MILDYQIDYGDSNWTLFNTYHYKKMAQADQKLITRFKTLLLRARNGRWYLYQETQ